MARAKAFYQKLGLEPLVETEEGSAQYQVGDTMFMLYPSEFAGSNQATAASFIVSDLAGAMAALKERGVVFEDVDYGDVTARATSWGCSSSPTPRRRSIAPGQSPARRPLRSPGGPGGR
jgi:hypothetical protein